MKTVLLIEDNNDIRENTCELLELEGYNVIVADNGVSGLTLAKAHHPDIILCDIMMPEANGYQVLNGLKNDPLIAATPFVFISSSVERKEVEAALGLGANGYIRKPFDAEELFETINRYIGVKSGHN
jgi:CheY-like chemotaxis protein